MKNILVPMDFSEVSVNALKYARGLFPDAQLHIVHASAPVIATDESFYYNSTLNTVAEINAELEKIIQLEFQTEGLPENMTIHILRSEIIPAIKAYVNDHDMDAMVIGSRDKYDFFDKWVGTISLGLVKTINLPTYLVPRYSNFSEFRKTLIASDYHLKSDNFLERIKKWNGDYNSYIKFLNVKTAIPDNFEEEKQAIIQNFFEEDEATFGFDIEVIESRDISSSLLESAYQMDADLLMVIAENQSLIGSLLFKSMSKELILKSDIPILFIHKDDSVKGLV